LPGFSPSLGKKKVPMGERGGISSERKKKGAGKGEEKKPSEQVPPVGGDGTLPAQGTGEG